MPTSKIVPKIPIGFLRISPKAKRFVNQVLDSNRLSYGPFTRRFESLFASLHHCRFAVASASGTTALQIALGALKETRRWKDNDEVLVPATTFIATPNSVVFNRLKPVFVEIEPLYYGMDPKKIEKKITPRTRAVLPVHLFGQTADMKPILAIAEKKKLEVVEDSAQTMLARTDGRYAGSFGAIGCFSTYMAHLLTTGIGGINTTQDPELAVILRSLINHGRDSIYLNIDDDDKAGPRKLKTIVEKRFSFVRLGQSARLTEMESAIGVAQLEDELEKNIKKRRENAARLTQLLSPLDDQVQLPTIRPGSEHSFMVYPLILKKQPKRKLVEFLEQNGVETRDLMPLMNQPVYKKMFPQKGRDYPVSRWLMESGFYMPCHPGLSQENLEFIASLIRRFFKR